MTARLVPIPAANIVKSQPVWFPFVKSIADRSRRNVAQLMAMVNSGEVQPILIWDDEEKAPLAFVGVRILLRNYDRIAEVIWLAGSQRKRWAHLLEDFERYAADLDGLACVGVRFVARLGWKKTLAAAGYRATHVVMEKDFEQ